ncbi:MAG: DNA topoisomerase I [Candidatus Marinimicrobia bacterium]|nr:DNA topoisomerase I [Candidatus Neomarinimicrobiota bacterium]
MKNHLIIVESPSKIKTLKKFLDSKYSVEASVGHIRDLPKSNLGIDVEKDFSAEYTVSPNSAKTVKSLKAALKKADELLIATDPDREGEAIAWHIVDELKPKIPVKRLVFNEITKTAILEALDKTRDIDTHLVDSQETRRFLDRLFGFMVSKTMWTNMKGGVSAGRVQSPAVKILVDREKERTQFIQNEYWSISAEFENKNGIINANLIKINGNKVSTGKSFDKKNGELFNKNDVVLNDKTVKEICDEIKDSLWKIDNVETKPSKQKPYAPFITSTLQQEGIRQFRMSAQNVMRIAQGLYENGYITYMRTDSVHLSSEAITASRNEIKSLFGDNYLPSSAIQYSGKVKNAQEAHEAIRPAGSKFKHPDELKNKVNVDELKLYKLIWKRTLASQMKSAQIERTNLTISNGQYIFEAKGKVVTFPGFLKVYVEGVDNKKDKDDNEIILPKVTKGESLICKNLTPKQHFTKPINRFTEAALVKELEKLGIGRPSTYATILKKIQDKEYVNKVKGSMIPTFTGYAVVQFLEKYFDDLVNLKYTSNMEDDLDSISRGENNKSDYLKGFYFGNDITKGLKTKLEQEFDKSNARLINILGNDKQSVEIRIGRYGVYGQYDEDKRFTIPGDFPPSELNLDKINELIELKNKAPEIIAKDPITNEDIVLKKGRFGPYIQCGEKMKSLPPNIEMENVDTELAINLASLPKVIGKWKDDDIKIDIGKFGPYIRCGKVTSSVPRDQNLFELSEKEAGELLNSGKQGRGPKVIKELGDNIEIRDGRYGMYITDGKVNAKMPKDISQDELTLEEAKNLIEQKKSSPKRKFRKK